MGAWTQEDVNRHNAKRGAARLPKASKYHNVKVLVDGERFDSKREATYWLGLKLREKVGDILRLRRQVAFPLLAPIQDQPGVSVCVSDYFADFVYYDTRDQRTHVVDAKGKRTQMYALKKKWLELQNGIVIEEV